MPSRFILIPAMELDELVAYDQDIEASLRLYFSPAASTFTARFAGRSMHEVNRELGSRLDESNIRSILAILTSLEARFQIDFDSRCRHRKEDPLSKYFVQVEQRRKRARLDEEILEGWKTHSTTDPPNLISDLRGAFKFRHWLAHGRYWTPVPRRYDIVSVRLMAEGIVAQLPFEVD